MDDDRIARLEQRIEELDRRNTSLERAMDKAMDRSRAAMATVVPSETRRHMRAAWRENLLAVRSMIDFWADRLSDDADKQASSSASNGQREKIQID